MITAVDTNIFLDLLIPNARFVDSSKAKLEKAHGEGELIVCEVVWAELASQFVEQPAIEAFFTRCWDSASAGDRGRPICRRPSVENLSSAARKWMVLCGMRSRPARSTMRPVWCAVARPAAHRQRFSHRCPRLAPSRPSIEPRSRILRGVLRGIGADGLSSAAYSGVRAPQARYRAGALALGQTPVFGLCGDLL